MMMMMRKMLIEEDESLDDYKPMEKWDKDYDDVDEADDTSIKTSELDISGEYTKFSVDTKCQRRRERWR